MRFRLAVICLFLLLPGGLFAQVLSEQQLDYLRQQFLEATAGQVDGSAIAPGTLPADRVRGQLPASKIVEDDPIALPAAQAAQATADAAQATADAASASGSSLGSQLAAVNTRVASAEANLSNVSNRVVTLESEMDTVQGRLFFTASFTTNLVFPGIGQTTTLYIVDGLITNVLVEGP